jgi:hypothetical protein
MFTIPDILSIMFAAVSIIGVAGGLLNRSKMEKGIGVQFIRYTALVVALPLAGAFVFQGMLTEAVTSLILGILSYVFPNGRSS